MDDVPVRNAHGGVQQIAAHEDPTTPGRVTQRQLVQHMVDGSPVDVAPGDPLPVTGEVAIDGTVPVTGPQTDAQARATPQPVAVSGTVDTELPVAAPLSDEADNTAVPTVGARVVLHNPTTGKTNPARSTALDGGGQNPRNSAATTPHNYDSTATAVIPQKTAKSLTDAESGAAFAGAGSMLANPSGATWARARYAADNLQLVGVTATSTQMWDSADGTTRLGRNAKSAADAESGAFFAPTASMLWDGAAWQRARSHQAQVVSLALAARTALTAYPAIVTRGARGMLMILHVEAAPATGNLGLYIKASGNNATLAGVTCPASLFAGASPAAPRSAGILVMPGSTVNNATASSMPTVAAAFSVVGVPVSPTHTMTGYVQPSSSDSWTYSLSHWLVA